MKIFTQLLILSLLSINVFAQSVDLQREAELMDELYSINGDAFLEELSNGDLQLRLSSNFSTPPGPDVRIILNSSVSGTGGEEVVNLSTIGHFNGALTVPVSSSVDIEDYDFIVFYCVAFSQLWASGEFGDVVNLGGPTCEESEVENANGSDNIDICPSDGNSDVIEFENSLSIPAGMEYVYLITDDNEILEEVVIDDEFDFEGSSTETQRVYGLHYAGNLNAMIGSDRMQTTASECFEHSNNNDFITVTKTACFECEESDVENDNGPNLVDICPDDNMSDFIDFSNSLGVTDSDEYVYLITDENEILEEVVFEDDYDFEGSGTDVQRVYGMHYDGIVLEAVGSHRLMTTATGCSEHSSDNVFITVTKDACIPAFVCMNSSTSTTGNSTTVDVCPNDGTADIIPLVNSLNETPGVNYAYLITDVNQILQEVVLTTAFNFEGTSLDDQRVYGVHYDGTLIPAIGSNRTLTTATGCAQHSSGTSFLTITKNACVPAFVCMPSSTSTSGNSSVVDICPTDGTADVIALQNSLNEAPGVNYAYLITDANQILQEVVLTTAHNFEGTSLNEQRVYGVHFDGTLTPLIGQNRTLTTATGCTQHSSGTAFLTVTKNACAPVFVCMASSTSTTGNSTVVDICPTDGATDFIPLQNSLNAAPGVNYAYLITDANQILQEVVLTSTHNFEGTSLNDQRVYGVHFDGTLTPLIGQNRMLTTATGCTQHSSGTFLTVTKNACAPVFDCQTSQTFTTGNVTQVNICPSDGAADVVALQNSLAAPAGVNYAYLITDENEILQEVLFTPSFNFEGTSNTTQRVYGVHFDGTLVPQIGQNRMMTSATNCHTHSSATSFLSVVKDACPPVFNCLASTVSSTSGNNLSFCAGDGVSDVVGFSNNIGAVAGQNYAYLLTDANDILLSVVNGSTFDFEQATQANLRVYGIHFDGTLVPQLGFNRLVTSASGCFFHSTAGQFLTVTTDDCIPAFDCMSSTIGISGQANQVDICPTDGVNDVFTFVNSLAVPPGENYVYLITDRNQILQSVITSNNFNFEGTSLDEQRVYGMHFSGDLNSQIGSPRTMTTASECFEHSSDTQFVTITKNACPPPFECQATLTATTNWVSSVDICPSDGINDNLELRNSLFVPAGTNYAYLITDESEIVQEVVVAELYNFEGSGDRTQRVYGVHFDGTLIPAIGQNRMMTRATGCFTHSDANTFLTVTKQACVIPFSCEDSQVSTTGAMSNLSLCTTDGIDDVITVRNSLNLNDPEHYAYLVTNADEVLQFVSTDPTINVEGINLDEIRVYGVHFDGTLNPAIGQNRMMTTATGCFTHSNSTWFLTIANDACAEPFECLESLTATTAWATSVDICPSDGEDDIVPLRNNLFIEPGENYAYLITDAQGILQEVTLDSLFNFEGSSAEEQRVYGIHYSGILQPAIGAERTETTATGCFTHSGEAIFLTISKGECTPDFECVETLTATTDWVTEVDICSTDGEENTIVLKNNLGVEAGDNYAYLITDEFEVLQEIVYDTLYNFNDTGIEEQRVYGLSFSGEIFPAIGEVRQNTTASNCFIHSGDNLFIRINKTAACETATVDIDAAEDIMIYPNPSSGVVNIEYLSNSIDFDIIRVFNTAGTMIDEMTQANQVVIETPGVYFLQFSNQETTTIKRIIISK